MLSDELIGKIVHENRGSLSVVISDLIAEANDYGSRDNITTIVLWVKL